MIELEPNSMGHRPLAKIKVIGVGGAGGNTINNIIDTGCQGFDCLVVNTDMQALEQSKASNRVQIGVKSAKGLGTGANPEFGARAAEEDIEKVLESVGDADIVFLAGGMGGGTGSGALPVIARAIKERNILCMAIVTKPFLFEGKRRSMVAEQAIQKLKADTDTLLVMPNQKLLDTADRNLSMIEAFGMINGVLGQSVRSISDIITKPGHINVDFADVRTIMKDRGIAIMGTGKSAGSDRAVNAARNAISSPLLENMSIDGAHAVLLNITGGKSLGLHEIGEAATQVYERAHEDANIILGSVIDESLEDEVIVTVIATGFSPAQPQPAEAQSESVQMKPSTRAVVQEDSDLAPDHPAQSQPKEPQAQPQSEVHSHVESAPKPESAPQSEAASQPECESNLSRSEAHCADKGAYETVLPEAKKSDVSTAKQEDSQSLSARVPANMYDLDVPTFLRKQAQDE